MALKPNLDTLGQSALNYAELHSDREHTKAALTAAYITAYHAGYNKGKTDLMEAVVDLAGSEGTNNG